MTAAHTMSPESKALTKTSALEEGNGWKSIFKQKKKRKRWFQDENTTGAFRAVRKRAGSLKIHPRLPVRGQKKRALNVFWETYRQLNKDTSDQTKGPSSSTAGGAVGISRDHREED